MVVVSDPAKRKREEADDADFRTRHLAICEGIRTSRVPIDHRPMELRKTPARPGEIIALVDDPENHAMKYPAGEFYRHEFEEFDVDGNTVRALRIIPTQFPQGDAA